MQDLQTKEPGPHVENIKGALHELIDHLRRDAKLVDDPKAAAMFETSAEVLRGVEVALEHFQTKAEPAWQKQQGSQAS
jgi:hypothetical protein